VKGRNTHILKARFCGERRRKMRFFFAAAAAVALLVLYCAPGAAQDTGEGTTPLNPDLPLEKPVPETGDDPPEEEETPPEAPPQEPPSETPPEEEPPANPPPEFFEEPIETAEVIFVIDRTGSMRWPSKMSVVDEGGNPVNDAAKVDVARIELIKAINNLAENTKFAMVCFSTASHYVSGTMDPNYGYGGTIGSWVAWPPAGGQPAPFGWHSTTGNSLPVWPENKQLLNATPPNKTAGIGWAQQRLPSPGADPGYAEVRGGTCTYDGMSIALKMVTPPPPGMGPGGEPKKSATGIYLLTDGAPTHLAGAAYGLCKVRSGSTYDSGNVDNDGTWEGQCMDLSKSKILAENIHHARIYTLGMGMNMACPNANVWNPTKGDWDFYPTQYNDKCRQFLTETAEATGGHYREVSK
jgi:hypothetical protein